MNIKNTFKIFIWASVFGAFFGIIGSQFIINYHFDDIVDNVDLDNLVSPHFLRNKIMNGDSDKFILVDLRSIKDYELGHIIGAINVPVQLTLNEKIELGFVEVLDEERIVSVFKDLSLNNLSKGKDIIIYSYDSSCLIRENVHSLLVKNNIFVKELNVGWYEWNYEWKSWNYPSEWDSLEASDYVYFGNESGRFEYNPLDFFGESKEVCLIDNSLNC